MLVKVRLIAQESGHCLRRGISERNFGGGRGCGLENATHLAAFPASCVRKQRGALAFALLVSENEK